MGSVDKTDPSTRAGYQPLGTTSRMGGAESAKDDVQQLKKSFDYSEWPNDAGFEGLTEHRGPIELKVSGTIPSWAAGSLYRTGPGGCTVEDTSAGTFHISHWFDGLAHTHKFDILCDDEDEGAPVKVQYSSLRQCDKLVEDIKQTGRFRFITFAQRSDPCVGLYFKFMTAFVKSYRDAPDNVQVTVQGNIPGLGKKLGHRSTPGSVFLGTDSASLQEVDPTTLEPLGSSKSHKELHPSIKGPLGPAHPCVDTKTGDYFSFNIEPGGRPTSTYRVFRVDAEGKTTVLATFSATVAYIHSFFLSPNYVVLCLPVAHMDGINILWHRSFAGAFRPFDEKEPTQWIVIDRHHGKGVVAKFRSEASFFFHSSNAFEDDEGNVICELVNFRNRTIVDAFYYDVLLNQDGKGKEFWADDEKVEDTCPHLVRFRLNKSEFPATGKKARKDALPWAEKVMDIAEPAVGDMPVINPGYMCRKHRYVWSAIRLGKSNLFDALGKTDTETGEVVLWEGPSGHTPSEAIFIPRPASGDDDIVDEDDGVLLSVILDGHNRKSYLLCQDAKTMAELGRAECEFAVGLGFHGQHLPGRAS